MVTLPLSIAKTQLDSDNKFDAMYTDKWYRQQVGVDSNSNKQLTSGWRTYDNHA